MKWLIRLAASLVALGALVGRDGEGAAMETAVWSSPGGGSVARAASQEAAFYEDPADRIDMTDATVPSDDAFSALQSLREMAKAAERVDAP